MLFIPSRFKILRKYLNKETSKHKFKILDIGCGSRSSHLTRKWLTVDLYHGLDKENWEGDDYSYIGIGHLYQVDLEEDSLISVKNNFYDVVILSHVIEHINNGLDVISKVIPKLNTQGIIYIESPSYKTLNYPSAIGFLNFYDDPTHKKVYYNSEIVHTLQTNGLKVLKSGFRNDWIRAILFLMPAVIMNLFYWLPFKRKFCSWGLWDILQVCSVWVAIKVKK